MISVIVPAYKTGAYIYECLSSICAQTYADLEIIVVYKKSSDATLAEIQRVNDKRIRIVEQLEANGPGGARNIGAKESQGEYIAFVDSDDIIDQDFFRLLYEAASREKADIAIGEVILKKANGNKAYSLHKKTTVKNSFFSKYIQIKSGASFDKIYRTDFVRKSGVFFPENIFYEDNYWTLALLYFSDKVVFVQGAIYNYRETEKDAERKDALLQDVLPAAQGMLRFCDEQSFSYLNRWVVRYKIVSTFAGGFLNNYSDLRQFIRIFDLHPYLLYRYARNKRAICVKRGI